MAGPPAWRPIIGHLSLVADRPVALHPPAPTQRLRANATIQTGFPPLMTRILCLCAAPLITGQLLMVVLSVMLFLLAIDETLVPLITKFRFVVV